jgi:hypothetical protein
MVLTCINQRFNAFLPFKIQRLMNSNLGIVHDKKESQSSSLYLAGCYSIDDEGLSMALA